MLQFLHGVNTKQYCHVFRVCVTNNNGFRILWLDLLALILQLQPIITAHRQWPPKTCSIPYWTRCLLFHSWTSSWFSFLLRLPWMTTVWRMLFLAFSHVLLFITSGESNRDHHLEQLVIFLSTVMETCLLNHWLAMDLFVGICCSGNITTESLLSNGRPLWLNYSGFQASCHNIYLKWHLPWHFWLSHLWLNKYIVSGAPLMGTEISSIQWQHGKGKVKLSLCLTN
jgi:hypothetical protein